MKNIKSLFTLAFLFCVIFIHAQNNGVITVKPLPYENALRNPLKGFTTRGIDSHPWATTAQVYIRWNELENDESDGIDKIMKVSEQKWGNVAEKNVKVIPRVYLHWNGNRKFWPADMQEDDYTSEQFRERVLRLIYRLGECWDNDPRVAFVEMGIFGKWGEQHSPYPTPEMEKLVGDAFAEAFQNKKVSVRRNWERFTEHPYGVYWDSWAHYDQMWPQGNKLKQLNEKGRYLENYVGGETAYDWGNADIQPGPSPTHSVAEKIHREFVINTVRWLHCTQFRWISDYDLNNPEAVRGAEEIQKVLGYRYEIDEVRYSISDSLYISFDIRNTGSAPFYYDWPLEIALLDEASLRPVWKARMRSADIRDWHPGSGWTEPEWTPVDRWCEFVPNIHWTDTQNTTWTIPPSKHTLEENFKINVPAGRYILSMAILDPAGNLPSIRFATANYLQGGRHPFGIVNTVKKSCEQLAPDFPFDDPGTDLSLFYNDEID